MGLLKWFLNNWQKNSSIKRRVSPSLFGSSLDMIVFLYALPTYMEWSLIDFLSVRLFVHPSSSNESWLPTLIEWVSIFLNPVAIVRLVSILKLCIKSGILWDCLERIVNHYVVFMSDLEYCLWKCYKDESVAK